MILVMPKQKAEPKSEWCSGVSFSIQIQREKTVFEQNFVFLIGFIVPMRQFAFYFFRFISFFSDSVCLSGLPINLLSILGLLSVLSITKLYLLVFTIVINGSFDDMWPLIIVLAFIVIDHGFSGDPSYNILRFHTVAYMILRYHTGSNKIS